MGFFTRKNKESKKKTDNQPVNVSDGKRDALQKEKEVSMKELYSDKNSDKANKQTKQTEVKKDERKIKKHSNAYKVLVKPLITEKATNLGVENKYVFEVAKDANKIEIAKAIDEVYGIKPIAVNIIKIKGKKTRHGKVTGKRKDWKKAIITLPEGKNIKVYEGV